MIHRISRDSISSPFSEANYTQVKYDHIHDHRTYIIKHIHIHIHTTYIHTCIARKCMIVRVKYKRWIRKKKKKKKKKINKKINKRKRKKNEIHSLAREIYWRGSMMKKRKMKERKWKKNIWTYIYIYIIYLYIFTYFENKPLINYL